MPPIPSSSQTRRASTSSRKSSVSFPSDYKSGVALTKAASRHRGKPTNHKKPKKVKVTKEFKDKVVKSLAGKTISGSWDQVSFDALRASTFLLNQQYVDGLGEIVNFDYSSWAFDPEDFLHAASVLWNGKADTQGGRLWSDEDNIGHSQGSAAELTDSRLSGTSRYSQNQKINVKRSYEVYRLKNNTQRTIIMKIYLCAPRKTGFKNFSTEFKPPLSNAIGVVDTFAPIGNPGQVWVNELNKQVQSNINVGSATVFTLFNSPKDCPGFNGIYKSDVTTIVLEPGQIYEYYINGPTNFTIDYNKLFEGQGSDPNLPIFYGIQKWMRYPLFTAYLDLATDGVNSGHIPPSATFGDRQAVAIERQMKFNLEMPESVGMNLGVPDAGGIGVAENNLRRDCYFRKVYTVPGVYGAVDTVNVQNPTMVIDQT